MKITGQLVCGPGEADRYLEETLREFKRLCDDVIVCLCNAGPKEKKLINKYDFRSYEDNREWGKKQPFIKTDLLRRIGKLGTDWILVLDADETIPTITDRSVLEKIAKSGREAAHFYVVNLWNDEQHYKKSMGFWNCRYYAYLPERGTQFLKKPVHCGNAPPYFYSLPPRQTYVPHILLHKGLLKPGDRFRKSLRYNIYDPHADYKGREYYDALVLSSTGAEYDQQQVLNKINHYCQNL